MRRFQLGYLLVGGVINFLAGMIVVVSFGFAGYMPLSDGVDELTLTLSIGPVALLVLGVVAGYLWYKGQKSWPVDWKASSRMVVFNVLLSIGLVASGLVFIAMLLFDQLSQYCSVGCPGFGL